MVKKLLLVGAISLLAALGCDKDTDPAARVERGQSAVNDARAVVAEANAQTTDPATLAKKLTEAEGLSQAGQIPAAKTLLAQIEPNKDALAEADRSRFEDLKRKLGQ